MSNRKQQMKAIDSKLEEAIQLTIEATNQLRSLIVDVDQLKMPMENVEEEKQETSYQKEFDKLYNGMKNDPGARQFFDDEEDLARSIRKYLGSTDDSHSEKKESDRRSKTFDLRNDNDLMELSTILDEAFPDTDVKILVS